MRRTLVLKKETLVDLSPHDLAKVAGAAATPTCPTFNPCEELTDYCVSLNYTCAVSQYINPCLTSPCS